MAYSPKRTKLRDQKPLRINVDRFDGGTNVLLSETRIKNNEARESLNLMYEGDGVWTKRWGTSRYGTAVTGPVDGFREYIKTDGTRELIIIDNGTPKKSTNNGATWTTITGGTFTAGNRARFHQLGVVNTTGGAMENRLYIVNGVDALAYYDGTDINTYSAIGEPAWAGTPITRTGLTDGTNTYYYRVTASNDVGESDPSTEQSITVNKTNDLWDTSNYVTLDWDAVSGANSYQVYRSNASGYETYLGATTATGFVDYGSPTNDFVEPPYEDQTAGPILKDLTSAVGRLWGIDAENRVWFTGNATFERGSFGPYSGGGWTGVDRGGKTSVEAIESFQGKPVVFLAYPEGGGQIWQIDETSITVADESVTVMVPKKILDATGSSSPGGVVSVENDIFYFDKDEVRVLGNEPGVLSVLRTNALSTNIRPYLEGLMDGGISDIEAIYYRGKVLWSVPRNSTTPDRIVVFDRERNAWHIDWSIGVTQFGMYTDTNGKSHLLGSVSTGLIDFSENYATDYDGSIINTKFIGKRIPMSDNDFTAFAKVKKLFLQFRNTSGANNVTVTGTGKSDSLLSLATKTIVSEGSTTGLTYDLLSTTQLSTSSGVPSTYQNESDISKIRINKLIRDIQVQITTTGVNDRYTLIGMQFEGLPVETGDPSGW